MTLRELLYSILSTDAQSAVAGSLGVLLGQASSAPFGVVFMTPPVSPTWPLLTYFFNAGSGRIPRDIFVQITGWGDDYEAILKRVYALLDEKQEDFATCTDFHVMQVRWNWQGPDRFDDTEKVYNRQERYKFRVMAL